MCSSKVDYIEGDTIAAIATPIGSSGIGIIRISGERAADIAGSLFTPIADSDCVSDSMALEKIASHKLKHGYIRDPSNGSIIDEILLVIMRAPHSYTREDVVEIQSHCGPVILSKILKLVIAYGARMAMPGEFTRRAFLNGRIDLSQAEAVGEMISARSEAALNIAVTHLTGHMRDEIYKITQKITELQIALEAEVEFGDELSNSVSQENAAGSKIQNEMIDPVKRLIDQYKEGYMLRDGIRLGIAGRPNVGKSSLLNILMRKDRAIVTPFPGTTRDLIEEAVNIDGVHFLVSDTAGLHTAIDPVEKIGIQKTKEHIRQTDLILFMVDASEPFISGDDNAFEQIDTENAVVLINKIDLVNEKSKIQVPSKYRHYPVVHISAKYGQGIENLKTKIKEAVFNGITIETGRHIVPTLRQKHGLESALNDLKRAKQCVESSLGDELVLMDLASAKEALNEIVGNNVSQDLLDDIFSKFCIGK